MLTRIVLAGALVAASPATVLAAATPGAGRLDPRIRTAVYHPDQVFIVETDLKHATTIRLGNGEQFQAVIVGDTESFEVEPIPEIGNVLTVKPHVKGARTNMTVITDRRSYAFHLVENAFVGGEFFEVRFSYPGERQSPSSSGGIAKGGPPIRNTAYLRSGEGDFVPRSVWDDGRYTYFAFAEGARQPAIFKVDARGRERSVNWTQGGDVVRVLGVSAYWTLRIGEDAVCVYRDPRALSAGG